MPKMAQKLSRVQMFDATGYAVSVFSKMMAFSALRMMSGISCSGVLAVTRSSFPFVSSIWRACLKLTKIFPHDLLGFNLIICFSQGMLQHLSWEEKIVDAGIVLCLMRW